MKKAGVIKKTYNSGDKPKFNAGLFIIIHIHRLLMFCTEQGLNDNVEGFVRGLRKLLTLCRPWVKDYVAYRDLILDLRVRAANISAGGKGREADFVRGKEVFDILEALEEIEGDLIVILDERGLYMPKWEVSGGLREHVEKELGVDWDKL